MPTLPLMILTESCPYCGGSSQIPVFVELLRRKFGAGSARAVDTFSSVTAGQRWRTGSSQAQPSYPPTSRAQWLQWGERRSISTDRLSPKLDRRPRARHRPRYTPDTSNYKLPHKAIATTLPASWNSGNRSHFSSFTAAPQEIIRKHRPRRF